MAKKKPTASERRHMTRVADLGCMACKLDGYEGTPAELHHPRFLAGAGQRSPHTACIPLCPIHHRTGGKGVAYHAAPWTFEAVYGTEESLLRQTYEELGEEYPF